jgi:hypothetical protein
MRTSFHHQPEAQHPKIFSYPQAAGRLPHLLALIGHSSRTRVCPLLERGFLPAMACPLLTQLRVRQAKLA